MRVKQAVSLILLVWNLFVFVAYGLDKYKARKGAFRLSEKSLLWMTYLGGGLGAWAGGTRFRHKTSKWYFRLAWFVGVIIDGMILYWMTSE